MTEQQEIQLKNLFLKHSKVVNGFLNIDSNISYENYGITDFDLLIEEIHKLYTGNKK